MNFSLEDKRGLASLPVIADWQEWWREWGPKIAAQHGKAGWILFLLDSNDKLQEVAMMLSRIIRNKPKWNSMGWSEREWLNCEETAGEALAWFERNAPSPMREAPEWAKFLFTAQHGNHSILARLGRELRGVQENGYAVAVLETDASGVQLREVA